MYDHLAAIRSILAAILDFDHFGHPFSKIGRHYRILGKISV